MQYLEGITKNPPLIAAFFGWLTAQVLKTILYGVMNHDFRLERLIGSGGMPSSHAATVLALTVSILIHEGTASVAFALSMALSAVVLHDARGVRLETGKQAQMIRAIVNYLTNETTEFPDVELKELIGHTPFQVLVGAIIGVSVGLIVG